MLQAYVCNLHLKIEGAVTQSPAQSPASAQGSSESVSVVSPKSARAVDLSLILVSASADPTMFKELHEGRLRLEEALQQEMLAARLRATLDSQNRKLKKYIGNSSCLHCFYKFNPASNSGATTAAALNAEGAQRPVPAQCLASGSDFPLDSQEAQDIVWLHYQRLALCMRAGTSVPEVTFIPRKHSEAGYSATANITVEENSGASTVNNNILSEIAASDHALAYIRLNAGYVIVALATSDTELYATFSDAAGTLEACSFANYLHRQLKIDTISGNVFQVVQ
jgi:hypothetical protein